MKQMKKLFVLFALATLVACGSSQSSSDGGHYATNNFAYESASTTEGVAASEYVMEEAKGEEVDVTLSQEKLVYTGSLSIETLDYGETMKNIRAYIKQYGGIIEYEEEYDNDSTWYYSESARRRATKNSHLTLRIPTENFETFLTSMEGTGKIRSRSTNVENITRAYNNTASRIESLETQHQRLLEMMEEATTVEDMIIIEERLSEVERELKTYQNDLNRMDTDVKYSTIHLSVQEVMEYTPEPNGFPTANFLKRIQETWTYAWENFVYFLQQLVLLAIRLLPFVLLIAPIIYLYRWYRKKHPRTKEGGFFKRKKKEDDQKKNTDVKTM